MNENKTREEEARLLELFAHLEYGEPPFFAFLNENEIWGPFVVVDPQVGELLGTQLGVEGSHKITWFSLDDVERIISFSGTPQRNMSDGSVTVRTHKGTVMIRPLWESDYVNFNLPAPVSMEELYLLANQNFAPIELEDE